jgi:hypothetical protein
LRGAVTWLIWAAMEKHLILPQWIVVRLGNDMNWWVEKSSEDIYWPREGLSVLDPRQFRDVVERVGPYAGVGFRRGVLTRAFALFVVESEMAEGRLRLKLAQKTEEDPEGKFFALPLLVDEEEGGFHDFVEHLIEMRVKLVNRTHQYAHSVDDLDLEEELQAKLTDRYFQGGNLHSYDEINEILGWAPANWDGDEEEPAAGRLTAEDGEGEEDNPV